MGNHKCCDCGKIVEPDKELRFFEKGVFSGRTEGYLCEGCADRRLEEWNPQPNETTIKAMQDTLEGKNIIRCENIDALFDSLNVPEG